jgi:hypothetical protein
VLRPHEVFYHPRAINLETSITIDTPDAWKHSLDAPKVSVLPLVDDLDRSYRDGWCTYTYEHVQAPELEIICGGINAKTHLASGIWRQGNLLHFGFEQSPAELNEQGKALLVNSICYIARFTEDRPIVRLPDSFRPLDRGAIDRLVKRSDRELDTYLDWYLGGKTRQSVDAMNRDDLAEWYRTKRGFLRADARGKFVIDDEAETLGIAPDAEAFIPAAIADWSGSDDPENPAKKLLYRYVQGGPDPSSQVEDWKDWWEANRSYLFFTDTGGFVWQVDRLAKKRGVPTGSLRGSDRASKPAISMEGNR